MPLPRLTMAHATFVQARLLACPTHNIIFSKRGNPTHCNKEGCGKVLTECDPTQVLAPAHVIMAYYCQACGSHATHPANGTTTFQCPCGVTSMWRFALPPTLVGPWQRAQSPCRETCRALAQAAAKAHHENMERARQQVAGMKTNAHGVLVGVFADANVDTVCLFEAIREHEQAQRASSALRSGSRCDPALHSGPRCDYCKRTGVQGLMPFPCIECNHMWTGCYRCRTLTGADGRKPNVGGCSQCH